jgi:hypothetical protein
LSLSGLGAHPSGTGEPNQKMSIESTDVAAVYRYADGSRVSLPVVLVDRKEYRLQIRNGVTIPARRFIPVSDGQGPDVEFVHYDLYGSSVRPCDRMDRLRAWLKVLPAPIQNQPHIPIPAAPPEPKEPEGTPGAPMLFRNGVPIPIKESGDSPAGERSNAFATAAQAELDRYAANLRQSGRRH